MTRYFNDISLKVTDENYQIFIGDKRMKSPEQREIILPNKVIAEIFLKEWQSLKDKITHETMPITKFIYSLTDRISSNRPEHNETIFNYITYDGLCYFAPETNAQIYKQQQNDRVPIIETFNEVYDLDIKYSSSLDTIDISPKTKDFCKKYINNMSDDKFTILYQLVHISGSFIIGLLTLEGKISSETAFVTSQDEEYFNIEKWGHDEEAIKMLEAKKSAWEENIYFLSLLI